MIYAGALLLHAWTLALKNRGTRTFTENILDRIDRDRVKIITAALTLLKGTLEKRFSLSRTAWEVLKIGTARQERRFAFRQV